MKMGDLPGRRRHLSSKCEYQSLFYPHGLFIRRVATEFRSPAPSRKLFSLDQMDMRIIAKWYFPPSYNHFVPEKVIWWMDTAGIAPSES